MGYVADFDGDEVPDVVQPAAGTSQVYEVVSAELREGETNDGDPWAAINLFGFWVEFGREAKAPGSIFLPSDRGDQERLDKDRRSLKDALRAFGIEIKKGVSVEDWCEQLIGRRATAKALDKKKGEGLEAKFFKPLPADAAQPQGAAPAPRAQSQAPTKPPAKPGLGGAGGTRTAPSPAPAPQPARTGLGGGLGRRS